MYSRVCLYTWIAFVLTCTLVWFKSSSSSATATPPKAVFSLSTPPPVTTNAPKTIIPEIIATASPLRRPPWHQRLFTPTFIARYDGVWFVVDCWHHRVLHHTDIDAPIEQWAALDPTSEGSLENSGKEEGRKKKNIQHQHMTIPHSIAWDGSHYAVETSNGGSKGLNHSILIYIKNNAWSFTCVQEILVCDKNKARRPHRLIYDSLFTKAFYLYTTSPPHLSKFARHDDTTISRVFCVPLPFMKGSYARSMYIHTDGFMYIVSGPRGIWKVDHKSTNHTVLPVQFYSVRPLGWKTMNDLFFSNGFWYGTSTTPCGFKRFKSMDAMATSEDMTRLLGLCRKGSPTPYFMSVVDGRMYVPFIFGGFSGAVSFMVPNANSTLGGGLRGIVHHWKKGGWQELPEDANVRNVYEKW